VDAPPARSGCATVALTGLAIVAGVVVGLIWLYSEFRTKEPPADFDFRGAAITEARRAAAAELGAELDAVERRSGIEQVGPRGRIDRCQEGQYGWTAKSPDAYWCQMEVLQLFAVGKPSRIEAARLGEALMEGDCPEGTDTDLALREEPYLGDMEESTGDCRQGVRTNSRFGPLVINGWMPARPNRYELKQAAVFRLPAGCFPTDRLCDETPLDLRTAAKAAPRDATWLGIVVAYRSYYEVDW
jgi:hypothetical protein